MEAINHSNKTEYCKPPDIRYIATTMDNKSISVEDNKDECFDGIVYVIWWGKWKIW